MLEGFPAEQIGTYASLRSEKDIEAAATALTRGR